MITVHTPIRQVRLSEYDLETVADASSRLALGADGMSEHEYTAAAIINGRLDLLEEGFRKVLIRMGRAWAHAVVEVIFDNWEREMTLRSDDPECPIGDQRIFTGTTTM